MYSAWTMCNAVIYQNMNILMLHLLKDFFNQSSKIQEVSINNSTGLY